MKRTKTLRTYNSDFDRLRFSHRLSVKPFTDCIQNRHFWAVLALNFVTIINKRRFARVSSKPPRQYRNVTQSPDRRGRPVVLATAPASLKT
jgi:hypothetical protein